MGAGGETDAGVEFDDERGSFAGGGFGPLLDPCRCFSNISTIYRRRRILAGGVALDSGTYDNCTRNIESTLY